jgi:hypothetical protein
MRYIDTYGNGDTRARTAGPPTPLGEWVATAEALVPGGKQLPRSLLPRDRHRP